MIPFPDTDEYRANNFEDVPTPAEMNQWDAESITAFRIPEFTLMENASREAFHVLAGLAGLAAYSAQKRRILVLAGGGNNGGDGYALARHLHDAGHHVLVCHTRPMGQIRGVSRSHARLAASLGVPFTRAALRDGTVSLPPRWNAFLTPDIVVDALLGTGFSGTTREPFTSLIRYINSHTGKAFIFSLDIPSGLNGLTGKPAPEAVRANATVTFEAAKIGLALPESRAYTGELHVRRIGIPTAVREKYPASFRRLVSTAGRSRQGNKPSPFMHKGDAGRVLVIGGSAQYAGAPVLAALGALRAGAGLVTLASPAGVVRDVRGLLPEVMALPLHSLKGPGEPDETAWSRAMLPGILAAIDAMAGAGVLVLGPGLGREDAAMAAVHSILGHPGRPPLILDADGLYPLAHAYPDSNQHMALLRKDDIITPHPGEAARLLGWKIPDIQADRPAALRALCAACAATVVLKGPGTLVSRGTEPGILIPVATPTLAIGGSGDVLSGICAVFRSRIPSGSLAAALAAHVHARAGVILEERYPARGNLAREIANAVPAAMAELI